jgi:hypothetical protein
MLRESIQADGQTIDLEGLADTDCKEIAGLKNSKILIEYADVFMTRDAAELAVVREKLEKAMGARALVDAAGVASNFQRMVRIADGTGIPSDALSHDAKVEMAAKLDLNKYQSAKNTPAKVQASDRQV